MLRTDPDLGRKNFEVVGNTSASRSCFYFLGIPVWKTNLYALANHDLFDSAIMGGRARALVNITQENTYTMYFLLFGLQTVSLSGNVIEYQDTTAASLPGPQ